MRLMTVLTISTVAALTAAQAAHAENLENAGNVGSAAGQHLAAAVYEGVDTDGKRVRLTISEGGPEVLIRVDRQPALPSVHWSALIGTGNAAAVER